MQRTLCSIAVALACGTALAQGAASHLQQAIAIAKDDPILEKDVAGLCPKPALVDQAVQRMMLRDPVIDYTPVPPTRVFDNVYHVGIATVGSWAIQTSEGIILLDANNDVRAVEEALLPGLRKLGLDPAQIKYVVATHAHGDHFGGAQYLKDHFGTRIVMSEIDWGIVAKPIFFMSGNPDPSPRPKRDTNDIAIGDHGTLTLGDTTITLVLTPGHTPGTLSVLFPFRFRGERHNAMLWGAGDLTQFLPPLERFASEFAKSARPAARVSSHLMGDGLAKLQQINADPAGPNPYFYGEERFAKYMQMAVECAKAQAARPKS